MTHEARPRERGCAQLTASPAVGGFHSGRCARTRGERAGIAASRYTDCMLCGRILTVFPDAAALWRVPLKSPHLKRPGGGGEFPTGPRLAVVTPRNSKL